MKQSSKGKTPAHTVTREFTGTEMITSFSTDNNTIKVNSSKPTNQPANQPILPKFYYRPLLFIPELSDSYLPVLKYYCALYV